MEYDLDSTPRELEDYCSRADFVFNLAGVNRPKEQSEFMEGNFGFASTLLDALERHGNTCPVMLSSSAQASLSGRFEGSVYGESKLAGEGLFREYSERTGAPVLIYRFPNLYGKWCRPHYNSAVATFCDAIANGRPYTVNDPNVELELLYIDDLVAEMLGALLGEEHRCGYEGLERVEGDGFCYVPETDVKSLGEIVYLLGRFRDMRDRLECPDQSDPLTAKLYATYLSFLPPEDFARPTVTHADARGSFTELLHLGGHGQVSVNVSRPHITKGEHWHHTKHEKFVVLSGEGVIRFRRPGDATVISYRVSGDVPQVVDIPPGYTYNIENTGDTDMITLMWANECFDPARPDTIRLPVEAPKEEAK